MSRIELALVVGADLPDCLTRHDDIPVMGDKIFQNGLRAIFDVDVSPVHPRVVILEGRRQQEVSGLGHALTTRSLCGITVSVLDILLQVRTKVFGNHASAAERDIVGTPLNSIEFGGEHGVGVVGGVGNQESDINQAMRVGELGEELKISLQVLRSILEGGHNKNLLLVDGSFLGRLDGVKVNVLNRGCVDLQRGMMVVQDRRLHVRAPSGKLILGHIHGCLRRSPAVEATLS